MTKFTANLSHGVLLSTVAAAAAAAATVSYVWFLSVHKKNKSNKSLAMDDSADKDNNSGWQLWHASYATASFLKFQTVSAISIFQVNSSNNNDNNNQTDDWMIVEAAYRQATIQLAQRHPMLACDMQTRRTTQNSRVALWVKPGARPAEASFSVVDEPLQSDAALTKMLQDRQQEKLDWNDLIAALVPHTNRLQTTEQTIQARRPLFTVRLLRLPHHTFAVQLAVSHALADGTTYYRIQDDLHRLAAQHMMNNNNNNKAQQEDVVAVTLQEPALDWKTNTARHAVHEMEATTYAAQLLNTSWQFILGVLRGVARMTVRPRVAETLVLDKEAIAQVKDEYQRRDSVIHRHTRNNNKPGFISTNDILMAALQQATPNNEMGLMFVNDRARRASLAVQDAGNFISRLVFPQSVGSRPSGVRSVLQQGGQPYHFDIEDDDDDDDDNDDQEENDELPVGAVRRGNLLNVSSWVSQKGVDNWTYPKTAAGVKLLGHVPHPDFVKIPFDLAIIFSLDDDRLAIMHNFYPSDESSRALLNRLTAKQA